MASYPIKTGSNPPNLSPSPSTPVKPPTVYDDYYNCLRTTSCCVYQYGSYCFGWGSCLESQACCDDHSSCCPHEYPVCDIDGGTCLMWKSSPTTKLDLRRDFIGATHSRGGVYMYNVAKDVMVAAFIMMDVLVLMNGDVVAQGSQFSLKDVEVVVAQIDLDARISMSKSRNYWFLRNLPTDLVDEKTMNNQFEEPDQPMQY
ncbi:putative cysteine protease RD21B [Camellia lanceoleosa]|nr:putative cysteine protease RD21B [Camellia lanceoleosa]